LLSASLHFSSLIFLLLEFVSLTVFPAAFLCFFLALLGYFLPLFLTRFFSFFERAGGHSGAFWLVF
jgi:hypothetical protein